MAGSSSLRRFHLEDVRDTGIVIGEGAYAVVKELEFRGLKCVGKKLHDVLYENSSRAGKADMLQRFVAECELLRQLHHPHIVQFMGIRVEAGSELPELVMEYLPTTLRLCLDKHSHFPTEISCGILLEVALGLRYLHEFSPPIIHRDLSSNNVLLTTSMTAKISDLGVAKILDMNPIHAARMTQTQVPGTPHFMPPEALASRPKYTSKVDIFSLGVLMIHVLSGEWVEPSGAFAEDPSDPTRMVPVTEFARRHESIQKIAEGHPLLGVIEQCLSNVSNHRPEAAAIVTQLQAEHARLPIRPENRLELLQQYKSVQDELQQCSKEVNEALRRENEALRNDIEAAKKSTEYVRTLKDAEIEGLRQSLAKGLQPVGGANNIFPVEKRIRAESFPAQLGSSKEKLYTNMQLRKSEVQWRLLRSQSKSTKVIVVQSHTGLKAHNRVQWKRGADAPCDFYAAQAVVMEESVYVGGGWAKHKIFQYSWSKGVWRTLPECPVRWFGLIQFMGRLTVAGGVHQGGVKTSTVYQLISDTQKWQTSLPPMLSARSWVTAVARSSSYKSPAIAVCGGLGFGGVVCSTVEVFCQSTSRWHMAEPLPAPLYGMTSASIGDITYILGKGGSSRLETNHCFRVSLDSLIERAIAISPRVQQAQQSPLWMSVSNTPLIDTCAVCMGGFLVAIGGRESSTCFPSSAIHLLTEYGSWERVSGGDLPEPRDQSTAVCLPSGEIIVVGGTCLNECSTRALFTTTL